MRRSDWHLDGALLVDKPPGFSSYSVIRNIKRSLTKLHGTKTLPKIGHTGTLDPFATGLLIILFGSAVKLSRYLLHSIKAYEGEIAFGYETTSGDPTTSVSRTTDRVPLEKAEISDKAIKFVSEPYLQTPPMHSALKHRGKRLYELAREGISVQRNPRKAKIYEFNIKNYTPSKRVAEFSTVVSSGTYIRTLAQDLGNLLESSATLEQLRRTRLGSFSVENSLPLARIEKEKDWSTLNSWVPFNKILKESPSVEIEKTEARILISGGQKSLSQILSPLSSHSEDPVFADIASIYCESELIAIARRNTDSKERTSSWRLERVFTQAI